MFNFLREKSVGVFIPAGKKIKANKDLKIYFDFISDAVVKRICKWASVGNAH